MKVDVHGFKPDALFIMANPSDSDPLGDRSYLAMKFSGGLSCMIVNVDPVSVAIEDAIPSMVAAIAEQCEKALRAAVANPDSELSREIHALAAQAHKDD